MDDVLSNMPFMYLIGTLRENIITIKGYKFLIVNSGKTMTMPLENLKEFINSGQLIPDLILNADYDSKKGVLTGKYGLDITDLPCLDITGRKVLRQKGFAVTAIIKEEGTGNHLGAVVVDAAGKQRNIEINDLRKLNKTFQCINYAFVRNKGKVEIVPNLKFKFPELTMSKAVASNSYNSALGEKKVEKSSQIPKLAAFSFDKVTESEFNKPAQTLMLESMAKLKKMSPYYWCMLNSIDKIPVYGDDIAETLAVSEIRFFYNIEFISNVTVAKLIFYLIHEMMHIGMLHVIRGKGKIHDLWNIATDLYINEAIMREFDLEIGIPKVVNGVEIEADPAILYMAKFNMTLDFAKDTAESIYNQLYEENKDKFENNAQQQNQQGQSQSGNGQGNQQQNGQQSGGQQGQNGQQQGSQGGGQQQGGQGGQSGGQQSGQGSQQGGSQSGGQGGQQGNQQGGSQGGQGSQSDSGKSMSDFMDKGNGLTGGGTTDIKVNNENSGSRSGGQGQQGQQGQGQGQQGQQGQGQQGQEQGSGQGAGQENGVDNSGQQGGKGWSNGGQLMGDNANIPHVTFNGIEITNKALESFVSETGMGNDQDTRKSMEMAQRKLTSIKTRKALIESKSGKKLDPTTSGAELMQRYIDFGISGVVDWRTVLKGMFKYNSKKIPSVRTPSRPYMQMGIGKPGRRKMDTNKVVKGIKICVDVSGSITEETINWYLSEVANIFNNFDIEGELIYWSTEVGDCGKFKTIKDLQNVKPVSTGGTDVKCLFEFLCGNTESMTHKVEEDKPQDIMGVIILTDGCFSNDYGQYASLFGGKNKQGKLKTLFIIDGVPEAFNPCFGGVVGIKNKEL